MKKHLWLILTLSAIYLSGCATQKVSPLDTVTESAVSSNDATAIVQGCGNPPAVGIAYCRIVEGRPTDEKIFFYAPPTQCNREHCAFIKVFDNQGNVVFGAPFEKGQTKLGVSWKVLLGQEAADNAVEEVVAPGKNENPITIPIPIGGDKTSYTKSKVKADPKNTFDISQRGFWSWNLQTFFIGPDGKERQAQAQGDIVLRIYKKKYLPLQEVSNDPSFVFTWNDTWNQRTFNFKSTSGLRSYVGPN